MDIRDLNEYLQDAIDMAYGCKDHVPKPHTAALLVKSNIVLCRAEKCVKEGEILHPEIKVLEELLEQERGEEIIGSTLVTNLEPSAFLKVGGEVVNLYDILISLGVKKIVYGRDHPLLFIRHATTRVLPSQGIEVSPIFTYKKDILSQVWTFPEDYNPSIDERYMKQAIGIGEITPKNIPHPHVGVIIVKDGVIIGESHKLIVPIRKHAHSIFHAERVAIETARTNLEGATLYTTLEPCLHNGGENRIIEDCTSLILRSGIKQIVFGTQDPQKRVFGRGLEKLMDSGIGVRQFTSEEIYPSLLKLSGKNRKGFSNDIRRSLSSRL